MIVLVLLLLAFAPMIWYFQSDIYKCLFSINECLFKLYFHLEQNRKTFLLWLFVIAFLGGGIVYYCVFHLTVWQSFYYALAQFMFDVKTPAEFGYDSDYIVNMSPTYQWIYVSAFIAAMVSSLTILILFFKETIEKQYSRFIIRKKSHIVLFGLGRKGSAYLDSELTNNKPIVIIEKNSKNPMIEKYKKKYKNHNFAILIGDGTDSMLLNQLRLENCKQIVLLAGKDTENIEIALSVSQVLINLKKGNKDISHKNVYMHLRDKDLHKFYRGGGLFDDKSLLHIKMFSLAQNSAKKLFLTHDIDGNSRKYIDSEKGFSIVVAGCTELALEVIGQACEIAHFPNENELTIYCVDVDIPTLKRLIYHQYPNIKDIPNIKLKFKSMNFRSKKYYAKSFWGKDITNVVLCHENAQDNLDIASELADKTYRRAIVKNTMETKIHIAIYENKKIAKAINNNEEQFKYFDVFAETSKMAGKEMVIDDEMETIAKCIHYGYAEKYNPEQEFSDDDIEKEWFKNIVQTDRDSNRAQAYHLPVKVKALGLGIDERIFDEKFCLDENRRIFDLDKINILNERKNLEPIPLDDTSLVEKTKNYINIEDPNNPNKKIQESYKMVEQFDYFPDSVDTLFEKLIRSEKNRWNAHHYLRGWNHSNKKDKELKEHDCLVPLLQLPGQKENIYTCLRRNYWSDTEKKMTFEDYNYYYFMLNNKRYTVLYDIYSILYIPNFLAKINKRFKVWQPLPLKVGVTGHRKLKNEKDIEKLLKDELVKLDINYEFIEVISPLADGADRLVAKFLTDEYDSKLIVPLPFEKDEYKKDFSEESQNEFDEYLEKASSIYMVDSLDNNNRETCYLHVGQEVVDKCDVLIALWDGKPAKGEGGTGDIVAYAKKKDVKIIHIDTNTLNTDYINF